MLKTAYTFNEEIDFSSLSLIDFIIVASIEVVKVIFFDKPYYLEVDEDNQIYDEEKIPSYLTAKKRKHLLDEK